MYMHQEMKEQCMKNCFEEGKEDIVQL
jgi:hypothetical protein